MTTTMGSLGSSPLRPALPAGPARSPERIVLALDPTPTSNAALRWTVERARRSRVVVDVLTVLKPDPVLGDVVIEEVMLNGERVLHHAADALRSVLDDDAFRTLLSWGSPAREILDASEDADLLVVGTGNANRTPVFHHPSMAVRLTTVGRTDLAVIPEDWQASAIPARVVAGISGGVDDRVTIAAAAREAERLGARLELLHSWNRASFAAAMGSELAMDFTLYEDAHRKILDAAVEEASEHYPELEVGGILSDVAVSRVLREAAEGAALLVVGSHGTTAFDRFFVGSTSHDVVAAPVCPTLIVRSRTRRSVEVPRRPRNDS
ncbi:universal stress protein [Labedella populi]|uniref:Universal stress protein n=1 Tax=Labedella populi TaxID=2498850 RepID=A0A444Q5T7_9MICO|nr:universal stress protein [Labedella populi]RWZ59213.1 universal stress protein [Labedella populi]